MTEQDEGTFSCRINGRAGYLRLFEDRLELVSSGRRGAQGPEAIALNSLTRVSVGKRGLLLSSVELVAAGGVTTVKLPTIDAERVAELLSSLIHELRPAPMRPAVQAVPGRPAPPSRSQLPTSAPPAVVPAPPVVVSLPRPAVQEAPVVAAVSAPDPVIDVRTAASKLPNATPVVAAPDVDELPAPAVGPVAPLAEPAPVPAPVARPVAIPVQQPSPSPVLTPAGRMPAPVSAPAPMSAPAPVSAPAPMPAPLPAAAVAAPRPLPASADSLPEDARKRLERVEVLRMSGILSDAEADVRVAEIFDQG